MWSSTFQRFAFLPAVEIAHTPPPLSLTLSLSARTLLAHARSSSSGSSTEGAINTLKARRGFKPERRTGGGLGRNYEGNGTAEGGPGLAFICSAPGRARACVRSAVLTEKPGLSERFLFFSFCSSCRYKRRCQQIHSRPMQPTVRAQGQRAVGHILHQHHVSVCVCVCVAPCKIRTASVK